MAASADLRGLPDSRSRNASRRLAILLVVTLASFTAACGKGSTSNPTTSPTTTAPTSAPTTGVTDDPAASLVAYLRTVPGVVTQTGVVTEGGAGDPMAVVATELSPQARSVLVLNDVDGWVAAASLVLPSPNYTILRDTPIEVADVTGDGHFDFLVAVDAADAHPAVVISDDGGAWRLLTERAGSVYFGRDPHFVNGRMISVTNDCNPTCAEGTNTTVTWTYDRPLGVFTPSAPL